MGLRPPVGEVQAELNRAGWVPTGAIGETLATGRSAALASVTVLTSGTLRLVGGLTLLANWEITTVTFPSGATAANTPLNQWFCLVRQSDLAVLAKTADDTTTAWAANTQKTLALAATYTPTVNTPVYLGVLVVATTTPTLIGFNTSLAGANLSLAPVLGGASTTGLTNPASLGATAAAISASAFTSYGYVS